MIITTLLLPLGHIPFTRDDMRALAADKASTAQEGERKLDKEP
jgi:hypothetical protein